MSINNNTNYSNYNNYDTTSENYMEAQKSLENSTVNKMNGGSKQTEGLNTETTGYKADNSSSYTSGILAEQYFIAQSNYDSPKVVVASVNDSSTASETTATSDTSKSSSTSETNSAQSVASAKSKTITDDDIRSLMKELIKVFTMLVNCQRQGELNDINGIMAALEAKISSMEEARDEAYKSAMASAISNMVSGAFSIAGGLAQGKLAICKINLKGSNTNFNQIGGGTAITGAAKSTQQDYSNHIQAIGTLTQGCQQLAQASGGIAAAGYNQDQQDAEIAKEEATALLEFWKQNEQMDDKEQESFFNFLKTILSILQEYRQNTANAETNIARMN